MTTHGASSTGIGAARHAQVATLAANSESRMTYISDFDRELSERIDSGEDTASLVRWVSEKVLESYRNGITAGQNGAQVKRKGKSRRSGLYGRAPKEQR